MKKIVRMAAVILLSISMIFSLFSCLLIQENYKWFEFKDIVSSEDNNYMLPENSFTTVEDVVIIPYIKAITDDGYSIYVYFWSKTGKESVQINNILIKDNETVLLDYDGINKDFDKENPFYQDEEFEEISPGIFEGAIFVGLITEESFEMSYGKDYTFVLEVEVTKNDTPILKTINYTFVIRSDTVGSIV